jgi:formyltetrahydrofolate synthetase
MWVDWQRPEPNHIHHGNALGIDVRRITWKRVMNMNDRALRDIVVATTREQKPVTSRDLQAHGAMTVLLHKAFAPNLVQTLENNPVVIHGGPFANIAHGCNSVMATRAALKLTDYVVAINHFATDTPAEIALLIARMAELGVRVVLTTHWADGGQGATELANAVVDLCEQESALRWVYQDDDTLWDKVTNIATRVHRAASVTVNVKVRKQIEQLQAEGYGPYPVCVAKTPYSFSTDAQLLGAPEGHTLDIREVSLAAGAEFVVMVCATS